MHLILLQRASGQSDGRVESVDLKLITSIRVGPDGAIYLLEETGEAYTHEWLPYPLPYHRFYRLQTLEGKLELLHDQATSTPPVILPNGEPLVSIYEVSLFPDGSDYTCYLEYALPGRGKRPVGFGFNPDRLSTAQNSRGLFIMGTQNSGYWTDVGGQVWIINLESSIDRQVCCFGGVTDVAVSEEGRIYFSAIRKTDHGYFDTHFYRTDDQGETIDTVNRLFVTENFALLSNGILVANGYFRDTAIDESGIPDGVYTSADGGESWQIVPDLDPFRWIVSTAESLSDFVVARSLNSSGASEDVFLRFGESGSVMERRSVGIGSYMEELHSSSTHLFARTWSGQILSSNNGGVSWSGVGGDLRFRTMALLKDGSIVAADGQHLYHLTEIASVESGESRFHVEEIDLR